MSNTFWTTVVMLGWFGIGFLVGYNRCRKVLSDIALTVISKQQHANLFGYPYVPDTKPTDTYLKSYILAVCPKNHTSEVSKSAQAFYCEQCKKSYTMKECVVIDYITLGGMVHQIKIE